MTVVPIPAHVPMVVLRAPLQKGGLPVVITHDAWVQWLESLRREQAAIEAGGEVNTGSNLGAGAQVFEGKTGVDLRHRTLVPGANMALNQSATEIEIVTAAEVNNISDTDATDLTDGGETALHSHAGGGGEANTMSSPAGAGESLVLTKAGVDLPVKRVAGGTGLTASADATDVSLAHDAHTGEVTGSTALTIAPSIVDTSHLQNGAVSLAKMANMAQSTMIGRAKLAGTGVPTALGPTAILTLLATLPSIDEDDMVSDSAVHVPTQQSVKAYVDGTAGLTVGQVPIETHNITSPQPVVLFDWSAESRHSYVIKGWAIPSTNSVNAFLRVKAGGSVKSGAADYAWAVTKLPLGTTLTHVGDVSDSEMQLTGDVPVGSDANEGIFFIIECQGTTAVNLYPHFTFRAVFRHPTFPTITTGGGFYLTGVTSLQGLQFSFSGGNVERMHATLYGDATV